MVCGTIINEFFTFVQLDTKILESRNSAFFTSYPSQPVVQTLSGVLDKEASLTLRVSGNAVLVSVRTGTCIRGSRAAWPPFCIQTMPISGPYCSSQSLSLSWEDTEKKTKLLFLGKICRRLTRP